MDMNFTCEPTQNISDSENVMVPSDHIIQCTVITILSFCMVAFNIPVFLVVYHVTYLKNTGKFMVSLACTDVFLGMTCLTNLYMGISKGNLYIESGSIQCTLNGFFNTCFATVSVITMTFIAIDKYLSISYTLKYRKVVTPLFIMALVLLIWVSVFILYLPVFFGWGGIRVKFYPSVYVCIVDYSVKNVPFDTLRLLLTLIFPTIGILIPGIGIYKIARRQKLQINTASVGANKISKSDSKVVFTLFIMTMSYYIMWTPYFILCNLHESVTGHTYHPLSDFILTWLGASNSFVNPLIYIPTMKPYRHKLLQLLHLQAKFSADISDTGNESHQTQEL